MDNKKTKPTVEHDLQDVLTRVGGLSLFPELGMDNLDQVLVDIPNTAIDKTTPLEVDHLCTAEVGWVSETSLSPFNKWITIALCDMFFKHITQHHIARPQMRQVEFSITDKKHDLRTPPCELPGNMLAVNFNIFVSDQGVGPVQLMKCASWVQIKLILWVGSDFRQKQNRF